MPGTERRAGARTPSPRNPLLVPVIAVVGILLITTGLIVSFSGGGGGDKNTTGTAQASTLGRAAPRPSAATAAPVTAAPTPSAAPADACVSGKRLAAQAPTAVWLTVAGVRRGYLLAVPAAVKTASSLPVIVNFHGYHQDAGQQESYTHLSASGTAAGYLVMTPLGVNGQWNFVRRPAVGPDDVTFITRALDGLATQTCVSRARVFLTGMSDGADMAVALACADPSRFAAVVPVAASVVPASCGASPPSLLEIHGTSDPVVPYAGGGADRPAPFQGTRPQAARDRTARYASYAGCRGTAAWRDSVAGTRLLGYAGCPTGVDVGLLAVTGGGHTWPGAAPQPSLGATSTSFSANQLMLTYFQYHPRAGVTQPTAGPPTPSAAPAAGSNLLGGVAGSLASGTG